MGISPAVFLNQKEDENTIFSSYRQTNSNFIELVDENAWKGQFLWGLLIFVYPFDEIYELRNPIFVYPLDEI